MKAVLSVILFGMVVILSACDLLMPNPGASVQDALEHAADQFVDAFNRGDAIGVAALYAVDAKILPPGSDVIAGRDAIEAFWTAGLTSGPATLFLEELEMDYNGDLAYKVGRYRLTSGGNVLEAGKYTEVWKKQADGSWKIAVDIWNIDQ